MSKRKVTFLFLLLIGLLALARSIFAVTVEVQNDLSKASSIVSKVTDAEEIQIENFYIKWPNYKKVYYFTLGSSDQKFAIHRPDENYQDLKSLIKPGDVLKVYFKPVSNDYNLKVLQVEKNAIVIESRKDFNAKIYEKAILGAIVGFLLVSSSVLYYLKFSLVRFLNKLVQ